MRLFLATISLLAIFSSSCKKADSFTQFYMYYYTDFVVQSTVGINLPFNLYSPNITSNSESTFENNDTRKDKVEEIYLETLILTVNSPANGNLNFLKSLHLYLSAGSLPEIEVAWIDDHTDDGARSILLNTTDVNLRDYIVEDSFQIRSETKTDQVILSDYVLAANMKFWVDAKVLGI